MTSKFVKRFRQMQDFPPASLFGGKGTINFFVCFAVGCNYANALFDFANRRFWPVFQSFCPSQIRKNEKGE
jgi:hypothetical protein